MTITTAANEPSIERWQDGYLIPTRVAFVAGDGQDDGPGDHWQYVDLHVPALTSVDVEREAARQYPGDVDVLADALAALDAATGGRASALEEVLIDKGVLDASDLASRKKP